MGLTLLIPPTLWPVTLEEAKAQCRVIDDESEDGLLENYIRAATRYLEQTLGTSIAVQAWKLTLDCFSDSIELPRGPVTAITSVIYYGTDGMPVTLDPSNYTTDLTGQRQWLVRNSTASWPTTLTGINTVAVTYTAGMDDPEEDLRHAILMLVAHWFRAREAVNVSSIVSEIPFAVTALIQPYRRAYL